MNDFTHIQCDRLLPSFEHLAYGIAWGDQTILHRCVSIRNFRIDQKSNHCDARVFPEVGGLFMCQWTLSN